MRLLRGVGVAAVLLCAAPLLRAAPPAATAHRPPTAAEVLAGSAAADWRALDPYNTLYLELATGRVVIELAPEFAPNYVANVLALSRGKYFDGLPIERSQDNYVVQWGDRAGKKPVGTAHRTVAAEFERPLRGLALTRLPDPDTYASEVGFVDGFPVAADPASGRAWLVHCYGSGPLGFYERPEQFVPLTSVRVAAEVPAAQRTNLEVLRTDTPAFQAYLEARRNRHEEWFKVPAGRVDVCNVPVPVRPAGGGAVTK